MGNTKLLFVVFLLTFPFALVGAWYIKTGGVVYFVSAGPLSPIKGDTIQSAETNNKPVSLVFKDISTLHNEGLLSSDADEPSGLDPDFDANAALERLEYLKDRGDLWDQAVIKEIAELFDALKKYEENGGTYN